MQLKAYINVSNQTVYYASLKKCIVRKYNRSFLLSYIIEKLKTTTCYKHKQYKALIILI